MGIQVTDRVRPQVESECLRDALVALREIATSPFDADRSSARAALAEIEQMLDNATPPGHIVVVHSIRHAELLVSPPGKVKSKAELGAARSPIKAALAAVKGADRA